MPPAASSSSRCRREMRSTVLRSRSRRVKTHLTLTLVAALFVASPAAAQYSARRSGTRVELEDTAHQIVVSIDPADGNLTREMTVKGRNILATQGIPFMAPWANRLDEQAFYA